MAKYCENCGTYLKEDAKFCPECGEKSKVQNSTKTNSNRNIIIALVGIIAILAVAVALSANLFTPEVPLESRDFETFRMDVPVGSEFEKFTSMPAYRNIGGFIFLKNVGDKVTLWFNLKQDITKLNNDANLSICDDTKAYDKYFQIREYEILTNF